MKMNFFLRMLFFILIILAECFVLEYAIYWNNSRALAYQQETTQVQQIVNLLTDIRGSQKDIEIALGDYLATGDTTFLRPLLAAKPVLVSSVSHLRHLNYSYSQRSRIYSLDFFINRHLNSVMKIIEQKSTGSAVSFQVIKQKNYDADSIRQVSFVIEQNEYNWLYQQKRLYESNYHLFNWTCSIVLVLITGFTAILVVTLNKHRVQNDQNEKQIADLQTDNRIYAFINQVSKTIPHIKEETMLFERACQIAVDIGKFKMAWIGLPDSQRSEINCFCKYGIRDRDTRSFANSSSPSYGVQLYVLKTGNYHIGKNKPDRPEQRSSKPRRSAGLEIVLPIKRSGNVVATFNLYDSHQVVCDDHKIELLLEAIANISLALDNIEKAKKNRALNEVVASEKRFRALIEKSTEMLMLSTVNGQILYGSPAITEILGYSLEEIKNKPATEYIHPDGITEFMNNRLEVANDPGKSIYFQHQVLHKNGYWIWCEGTGINLLHEPDVNAIVSSFRDITDRKMAEMERIKMVNDLMLRNTELEQFTYVISHNLRAPVANIIGASDVLRTQELDPEEIERLYKGIHDSIMKVDGVIKDLNFILQTKKGFNTFKEIVYFSEIVTEIKFNLKSLIRISKIKIIADFSEINQMVTLKPCLYSIFHTLISNSIKYRKPDVQAIIEIKSWSTDKKIELSFADNGLGIDLGKNGGHVFGLYKRFHPHIEGKGMSLFIAKAQVETLGGRIIVESAENAGTTFRIEFLIE